MKSSIIWILILFVLASCDKSVEDSGIHHKGLSIFTKSSEGKDTILASNEDIIGYDSTKATFLLSEASANRIKNLIQPLYPPQYVGFSVLVDDEEIYKATWIPPYISTAYFDIITFEIKDNRVWIAMGYPASKGFLDNDLRNDQRIISCLEKQNKLIGIESIY